MQSSWIGHLSINLYMNFTCSFFWVYLAAVLRFLPGARMGCERKHGAVIKPLPQQEVSHREEALIYALIMFSSSPSQTDLKWREYFVRCSRLNKNLSTTSFLESERFSSPAWSCSSRRRWWANVLLKARGRSLIPAERSGLTWRKYVIWMQRDRLYVGCVCWWLITHRLAQIRASCGAWVDVKAQNISEHFSALSKTSAIFYAGAARFCSRNCNTGH